MKTYILIVIVTALAVLALVSVRGDVVEVAQDTPEQVKLDDSTSEDTTTVATPETPAPVVRGKTLDLSNKGLTKVPENTFSQTDLVSLDVSNNQLDGALQSQVGQLRNLVSLDLSNNNFTGVPAEVGQLSKLRYLDLSNNQLTGLPYELGNLKKLETLVLTGNDYSEQDLAKIREGLPASTNIVTE